MGSDLTTSGVVLLYVFDRYEQEAYRHATLENDFVVLKKVRGGVSSCFLRILSTHHAPLKPNSGLGGQGVGILMQHMISCSL